MVHPLHLAASLICASVFLGGCSINISPRRPAAPLPPLAVTMDAGGVVGAQFADAARAPIVRPRQDLLLTNASLNTDLEVTFVLAIPLLEINKAVGDNVPDDQLPQRFAAYLKGSKGAPDPNCDNLPRCEVTFSLPRATSATAPSSQVVPVALLELDASDVTPFVVALANPYRELPSGTPGRLGFVVSENKPASTLLRIPLDNSGIADWRFLNPRAPGVLPVDPTAIPGASPVGARIQQRESSTVVLQRYRVRFVNLTSDRYFVVSFTLRRSDLVGVFQSAVAATPPEIEVNPACGTSPTFDIICHLQANYGDGVSFTDNGDGETLTVSVTVPPGLPKDVDALLLAYAVSGTSKLIPFEVDFFDQTDDPAYSKGYLALEEINPAAANAQQKNAFTSNLVTGFTSSYDPCLGGATCDRTKGIGLATDQFPFDGEGRRHITGQGQLDLAQNLGSRADMKLSASYKSRDLGSPEVEGTSDAFRVSQFQSNIFATNGMIFTVGRFNFASPSNAIAINETGDGLRLAIRAFAFSYLLRRESNTGLADDHDKDHDIIIGQLNTGLKALGIFRRLNVTAEHGEDRCKNKRSDGGDPTLGDCTGSSFPHSYTTAGFELFFNARADRTPADLTAGRVPITGSIALYQSERNSSDTGTSSVPAVPDGEGRVGLLTIGRPFGFVAERPGSPKVKPLQSITAFIGYGTGDKPGTPEDEGYIGESSAFASDSIFLKSIAGRMRPSEGKVGSGLSNKRYFGLQYTHSNLSPLQWLTDLLHIRREDIASQSTTISIHDYRFNEPVLDNREAGQEFTIEFRMEQPKNVKWRVSVGYFIPGDGLDTLVREEPWLLSIGAVIEPAKLTF